MCVRAWPGLSCASKMTGRGCRRISGRGFLSLGERLDRQHPGQGIGLAVVKDIIESYNAKLALGDSPMGGAAFRIHFPAV